MDEQKFIDELNKIDINLDKTQISKLNKFYELLIDWNQKINLTTITEKKDVYLKHFYDSLTISKVINLTDVYSLCDVGSGAGFPGIVLKIVYPNLRITLIDSLQKRVNYLNKIINELELNDIVAIHDRMEEFSKKNEEKFDYIVTRAVSKINVVSEISIRALKTNGKMVIMKANCEDEINESKKHIEELGGIFDNILKFKLPIENSNRTLVSILKIKSTPKKYPRRYDKII